MLRNFRQVFKGNQMPMTVVMGIVLVGLVAYLAPTHGNPQAPENVVARVYGRSILKREVDRLIAQDLEQVNQRANLDQILPFLQQRAVNQLVQFKLREEVAERHGIVVTDAEVRQELESRLRKYPVFLAPDGQLLETREINQILQANRQSLGQWEEDARAGVTIRKLVEQTAAQIPVDEAWIALENRIRNEKLSLEAYTLKPDPTPVADPGDGPLAAMLKEGGARFQVPPRRVVQFVTLDEAFFGSALVATDADLKAAYESKKAQYTELKTSHILFKAKTEAEYAAALKKAQDLRPKLTGQDFAAMADQYSEDDTAKADHGSQIWFRANTTSPAFFAAADALKEGEISAPVRTEKGVHLIRLEQRRSKSFDEVKEELRAQITGERFVAKAKERLEQLRKRTGDRGDLAAAARNLGLKVQTTQPLLSDATTIPGLQDAGYVTGEAFRLKVGQVSRILRTGTAFTVIRVQEERPSAVPPLAEIRDRVLAAWKLEQARKSALEVAKAAIQSGNLKALGEPKSMENTTLSAMGELGGHPGIRKALLETPEGQFTPVLWNPEGQVWVARIKSRTAPEPLNFEKRHAMVRELQEASAQREILSELQTLYEKGRQRPGFSSLYGYLGGIWIDTENQPSKDDLPEPGDL